MLNILIRTSGRPNFFKKCIESIKAQNNSNYNIIVGSDDWNDGYVRKYNPVRLDQLEMDGRMLQTARHFPFNLYFNEMYKRCKPGYIMFLDDDDCFNNTNAVQTILANSSEDSAVFWRVNCNGRLIPSDDNFGKHPVCKDFSSIGMSFHTKYISMLQWDDFKQGDYRIASRIYDIMPVRWIDEVLTKTQVEQHGGSRSDAVRDTIKIVTLCPVWKRPNIFKEFIEDYKKFAKYCPKKMEIELICILSEEDNYYSKLALICEDNDIRYVIYKNDPVSDKLNAGINYICKNIDFDYLMNIGSDDLINPELWTIYKPYMLASESYFGLDSFYCYENKTGLCCKFSYHLPVGGGRMIHKRILKRILSTGVLYPNGDSGLDTISHNRIVESTGYSGVLIVTDNPMILDLKSDTNINSIGMLLASDLAKEIDYEIIKDYFYG